MIKITPALLLKGLEPNYPASGTILVASENGRSSLGPGLPRFGLRFAFTIIHGSRRPWNEARRKASNYHASIYKIIIKQAFYMEFVAQLLL